MRVVMIGGAGFLGYFTCAELLRRGHIPIAVGLSQPSPGQMPDGCEIRVLDTDRCSDADLRALVSGADAVIHAAGADGRNSFSAPAIDGFRAANVAPVARLVGAMQAAAVPRLVIFGSYYTALDRLFPDLAFLAGNAYPLSRREQADEAFRLGGNLDIAILELPYIFGGAPGRGTLWGYIMDKLQQGPEAFPVAAGGSACVSASQVASAAVGAIERSKGHRHYPIGGANLRYADIYAHFAAALGLQRSFVPRDAEAARAAADNQVVQLAAAGLETGYDPLAIVRWEDQPLYLDPAPAMESLGYGPADMAAAIRETVAATLAHGGRGPASLSATEGPIDG
jgi:nucleoside-diphosphate-sugar epimerase